MMPSSMPMMPPPPEKAAVAAVDPIQQAEPDFGLRYRHAELEHDLRRARRIVEVDRLGTARQDDSVRPERSNSVIRHIPGMDFTINASVTYASRNRLRVLGTKIYNQDTIGMYVLSHETYCIFNVKGPEVPGPEIGFT